jgi:diacylglycerol kinase family enzyme
LGAEVYLIDGPGPVDVEAVAERAVADGADLLGVAGGDGTQALVAGVAASFGAYAEIVQTPQYRDDKLGSTLDLLPDLLSGQRGTRLTATAGDFQLSGPQAVLIANNPYGMGDIAGLGRRSRLDRGVLGVVGVSVRNARQAAGLIRGARSGGLSMTTGREVIIDGDAPDIRVGIDGEAGSLPRPVRCSIRPGALRVRVPRQRPRVPAPQARMDSTRLRQLALAT